MKITKKLINAVALSNNEQLRSDEWAEFQNKPEVKAINKAFELTEINFLKLGPNDKSRMSEHIIDIALDALEDEKQEFAQKEIAAAIAVKSVIQDMHVNYCIEHPLDKIAVRGSCKFVTEEDEGYPSFESKVMDNPTWLEVAIIANDMILKTKDFSHCFFEGIYKLDPEAQTSTGPKIYSFLMGS